VEFLTPLFGSGKRRDGKPDATVLKAGITAQKMRYLEFLLVSPWNVQQMWADVLRPAMPTKTARRVEATARDLFAEVTDTIREAARIPQDRRLTPENARRACRYGLGEILGPVR
jgi:hypothetical protein